MQSKRITEPRLEELKQRLALMQEAITAFQGAARGIASPGLAEFGLMMGEYLGLCREAVAHGHDFEKHDSAILPVQEHNVAFVSDRLARIYGPTLGKLFRKVA
jgi:hypothetical protein